jgi:hypothetical protein
MTIPGHHKIFMLLLLLFSLSVAAQNYSIRGIVIDVDDTPISFVNVVASKVTQNENGEPGFTFINGTSTDEKGYFSLENLTEGSYLISFIYLGYHVNSQTVLVVKSLDIGEIKLEKSIEDLDEAVVYAKRPTIKKEPGKLIFSVEGTSLASGNVVQLLSKTPGVLVQPERISIKNITPVIYINDKRVYLSASEVYALLTNTDASVIKSIEVITNPGAQYDAEGGSVLNIITSKAISIGYKGSVSANYQQAVFAKYAFGTSHFYKNNWLNLSANYTFSPRKEFKDQDDTIRYFDPFVNVSSIWESDFQRITTSYGHQGNINADFTLGPKNTLSVAANIFVSPDTEFNNTVDVDIRNAAMQLDSTFITRSFLSNNKSNLGFNITHEVTLDEAGSNLKTAVNYILYDDDQFQEVLSTYFSPENVIIRNNSFFTNALQNSDIFTAQADAYLPQENAEFSMGAKYSNIDTNSSLDFFDTNGAAPQLVSGLSDAFLYQESIVAGYLDYTFNPGSWSINLGLRAENTEVRGSSLSLGVVNTQNYFELFPTLAADYTIDDENTIGLSYSRRITRPRYQSLNPFKYFLNENNFNAGNPNLAPAIDNKIKLSYGFKNQWFFDLYYQKTKNVLSILTFQDNLNRVIRSVDANLIQDFQYSLDVVYAASLTPWWYLSVYTSGFYFENEFYSVESVKETYSNNTFGFYGQMYSGFTLSNKQNLSADLTAIYLSDYIYGSYDYGDQLNVSLSFQKKLWDNRARIIVGVDDMFNTNNVPIASKYYNQDNSYFPQPESRMFRLGFRYSFGNIILKENNRNIEIKEAERLEKQ